MISTLLSSIIWHWSHCKLLILIHGNGRVAGEVTLGMKDSETTREDSIVVTSGPGHLPDALSRGYPSTQVQILPLAALALIQDVQEGMATGVGIYVVVEVTATVPNREAHCQATTQFDWTVDRSLSIRSARYPQHSGVGRKLAV